MAIPKFFASIPQAASNFFSHLMHSAPYELAPISGMPIDIIGLFFSLLDERSKANLGKVCKTMNATYIDVSPIGRSCKLVYANLKDAAEKLAKVTQERPLTGSELHSVLLVPSIIESLNHVELVVKANTESANFYNKFSGTLNALNITSHPESYGYCAALANQIIRSSFKNENVDPAKLVTVAKDFNKRFFFELCTLYASQPIDRITMENFKTEVASIARWFSHIDTIDIETELRKEIRAKHDSPVFDILRAELLSPDADSPHFVAIKAAIETKLIAEKNALQSELEALLGSNGFNGTVHAAFQEKQHAEAETNQAHAAFATALQPANNENELSKLLAEVGIQELHATYNQKAASFNEKKNAYDALATRLNDIAQYIGTTLSGGKLHTIEASLQPAALNFAARSQAAKAANFYNELKQLVGDHNKVPRSQALHAIMG